MAQPDAVRDAFPAVDDITDDDLRRGVIEAWSIALDDNGNPDVEDLAWYPPIQAEIGLTDETLLDHVRGVVDAAVALAESLQSSRGDGVLSMDLVLAGALVHDVSKPYEFDGMDETSLYDAVGHPTYGVHVCARAGLPDEVLHIVQSHSPNTTQEPASLEAEVVIAADHVTAAAAVSTVLCDLREW